MSRSEQDASAGLDGSDDALIAELERLVGEDRSYWPNGPTTDDYRRNAEAMGLKVQPICDSGGSYGAYYTVIAVYNVEYIFGAKPLCLVFEDFSKSVEAVWVMRP